MTQLLSFLEILVTIPYIMDIPLNARNMKTNESLPSFREHKTLQDQVNLEVHTMSQEVVMKWNDESIQTEFRQCFPLFISEMGSHYFAKASLKLINSSNPPVPIFQVPGMTGAHHHILLLENVSGKRLCEKQRS
jgi:hypothetical protein